MRRYQDQILCSFRKVFLLFHVLEMIVDQQQTHLLFDRHIFFPAAGTLVGVNSGAGVHTLGFTSILTDNLRGSVLSLPR